MKEICIHFLYINRFNSYREIKFISMYLGRCEYFAQSCWRKIIDQYYNNFHFQREQCREMLRQYILVEIQFRRSSYRMFNRSVFTLLLTCFLVAPVINFFPYNKPIDLSINFKFYTFRSKNIIQFNLLNN